MCLVYWYQPCLAHQHQHQWGQWCLHCPPSCCPSQLLTLQCENVKFLEGLDHVIVQLVDSELFNHLGWLAWAVVGLEWWLTWFNTFIPFTGLMLSLPVVTWLLVVVLVNGAASIITWNFKTHNNLELWTTDRVFCCVLPADTWHMDNWVLLCSAQCREQRNIKPLSRV